MLHGGCLRDPANGSSLRLLRRLLGLHGSVRLLRWLLLLRLLLLMGLLVRLVGLLSLLVSRLLPRVLIRHALLVWDVRLSWALWLPRDVRLRIAHRAFGVCHI